MAPNALHADFDTPGGKTYSITDLCDEFKVTPRALRFYEDQGLIHAERTDWIPRAKIILQFGDTQPFAPFDRLGHLRETEGKSLGQLLDEFARVRSESLDELRKLKLQPKDLDRAGRHPALGAVTLSELLSTWAGHDLTHLHQVSRILAYQYREAVGPFKVYLGVLQCTCLLYTSPSPRD